MRINKLFVLLLFSLFLAFSSWAAGPIVNLSTYSPAPYGVYRTVILSPTTEPAPNRSCQKGSLYTSIGAAMGDAAGRVAGTMYFCDNMQTWVASGGDSLWTLLPTGELYPTDVLVNLDIKLGLGTDAPGMQLHLNGSPATSNVEGILSTGAVGARSPFVLPGPAQGPGTRLLWYPNKAAFRAGTVSATQWDETNIANYSVAFGQNNTASGTHSTITGGLNNTASGARSTVIGGQNNTASGTDSIASGTDNSTAGDYSFVAGRNMVLGAAADRTFLWGYSAAAIPAITQPDYFMIYSGKLRVNSSISPYVASLPGFTPNFEIIADATDGIADINLQAAAASNPLGRITFGTTVPSSIVSSIMGGNNGNITFYVNPPFINSGNRFIFTNDANDNATIAMQSDGGAIEYVPTSPTNSTRIIRGKFNTGCGAGAKDLTMGDPASFTLTDIAGLGTCQVNFVNAFADTPIVTVTPFHINLGGIDYAATVAVTAVGVGSFQVHTMKITTAIAGGIPASYQNTDVFFTAIGKKPNF